MTTRLWQKTAQLQICQSYAPKWLWNIRYKRIAARTYKFDVSETVVMNAGARIINVQWDFDYGKRFSSTPGYSFVRGSKKEVALGAQYEFPNGGKQRIACKVQDDMGGEGLWTAEIDVK